MRLEDLPKNAARFFAKVMTLWCECPACGQVLHAVTVSKSERCVWDPRTARLACKECHTHYAVGLLLWPVKKGQASRDATAPRDQVPSERELVQLRAMAEVAGGKGAGAGWWMSQEDAVQSFRPKHTNITSKCGCTKRIGDTPGCPLHGEESGWVAEPREQVNEDKWPR